MRRYFTSLVLLFVAFALGLAAGPPLETKITVITRTLGSGDAVGKKLIHICFDTDIISVQHYSKTVLEVIHTAADIINEPFYQNVDQVLPGPKCMFFEGDITPYVSTTLLFVLEGRDENDNTLIKGTAAFAIPDAYVDDEKTVIESSAIVGARAPIAASDSLRLLLKSENSLQGWNVCIGEKSYTIGETQDDIQCTNKICYVIKGVKVAATPSFSLCLANSYGTGVFISKEFVPASTAKDTSLTAVKLAYSYEDGQGKATKPATLTVEPSSLEFVPCKADGTIIDICLSTLTDGVCEISDYNQGSQKLEIIIFNSGETKSDVATIEDYDILGTNLGASLIEMHWKRGTTDKYYAASIAPLSSKSIPATALIDCNVNDPDGAEKTHCFAYFYELVEKQYLVTVYPNNDDLDSYDPDMTNQIIAEPISPSIAMRTRIEVIPLLQDSSYADDSLQVCFKTSEHTSNNTRHEAILMDEEGHWIKIYQSTQGEDLIHCFSPINLLTTSLKIAKDSKLKAVIVEREVNGYQIIASGQVEVDVSALRAIKPEVDNGSEGSTSTLAIVGAAVAGIACLMALVAAAIMFVMKIHRDNDGLQYPLHRTDIEDSNINHGLDNSIPAM